MNQLPRRALSRYGLTFQGNILSVNCQCRMLTRVRRTHSTSPVENSLITNLSFVGYRRHLAGSFSMIPKFMMNIVRRSGRGG